MVTTEPIRVESQTGCGWRVVCSTAGINMYSKAGVFPAYCKYKEDFGIHSFIAALAAEMYRTVRTRGLNWSLTILHPGLGSCKLF